MVTVDFYSLPIDVAPTVFSLFSYISTLIWSYIGTKLPIILQQCSKVLCIWPEICQMWQPAIREFHEISLYSAGIIPTNLTVINRSGQIFIRHLLCFLRLSTLASILALNHSLFSSLYLCLTVSLSLSFCLSFSFLTTTPHSAVLSSWVTGIIDRVFQHRNLFSHWRVIIGVVEVVCTTVAARGKVEPRWFRDRRSIDPHCHRHEMFQSIWTSSRFRAHRWTSVHRWTYRQSVEC